MLRVTKERDGAIVGGLTFLLILLWLGFFVHRAPRFAGSVLEAGGVAESRGVEFRVGQAVGHRRQAAAGDLLVVGGAADYQHQ